MILLRRILVTGPPLSGRDEYVEKTARVLAEHGVRVRVHHVYDYMRREGAGIGLSNITRENILDIPEPLLRDLRARALRVIKEEMREDEEAVHIVSTPNVFPIKPHTGTTRRIIYGLTEDVVAEYIEPQLIIVAVDDALRVVERMRRDEVWSRRFPHPSLEQAVVMREESIENVERIVRHMYSYGGKQVPYVILSVNHPPRVLAEIILEVKPRVYLSYNMTGMPPEAFENVRRMQAKLSKHFVVFDPGTINEWKIVEEYDRAVEEGKDRIVVKLNGKSFELMLSEVEKAIDMIRAQIVSRDYNLIDNADAICVYHHGRHPSYGVMAEVMRASMQAKPVYVLYPYKRRLSPFFEHYVSSSYYAEYKIVTLRECPGSIEELEDKLVSRMLADACSGYWVTWRPNKDYVKTHCKDVAEKQ